VNKLFIKLGEGLYQEMDKAKDLTKLIKKSIVDKNGHVKTVWVKMAFDNSADIFKKYSQIGFSERYNEIKETSKISLKVCESFENKIINADLEYCGSFDSQGKLLLSKKGEYDKIELSYKEAQRIKNIEIFTHNHPEKRSFSMEDLILSTCLGVKELRAVHNKTVFSFKISAVNQSSSYFEHYNKIVDFFNKLKEYDDIVEKEFKDLIDSGFLTLEKAYNQHQHVLLNKLLEDVELKKIFHIQYNVIERKDEN